MARPKGGHLSSEIDFHSAMLQMSSRVARCGNTAREKLRREQRASCGIGAKDFDRGSQTSIVHVSTGGPVTPRIEGVDAVLDRLESLWEVAPPLNLIVAP